MFLIGLTENKGSRIINTDHIVSLDAEILSGKQQPEAKLWTIKMSDGNEYKLQFGIEWLENILEVYIPDFFEKGDNKTNHSLPDKSVQQVLDVLYSRQK